MTAPRLKYLIEQADGEGKNIVKLPKYEYPRNVISSAWLGKLATVDLKIKKGAFVRQLDSQKEKRKAIFGCGLLISNESAKEIREAEEAIREEAITWELSDREREIISKL